MRTVDAAGETISTKAAENLLAASCNMTCATRDVDAALATCAQRAGLHDVAQVPRPTSSGSSRLRNSGCSSSWLRLAVATCFWWLDHRAA
ncbi:MAG: hypothetical protein R2715_04400 [Ilumatobacteraceae bacterium]